MFFTPELLARRDSGFGLLWLAATLGSKSTFKKLPRRSVLTADITQLCEQIATPEEPLALRLSSNLLVGVARVYKIKQEIFMNDVTNCVSSLKKVVQEIQTVAAKEASHQMQQQTRPSAFTLAADPQAMYLIEFDDFIADWDEFLNLQENPAEKQNDDEADDQEYKPSGSKKSKQKNANPKVPPLTEEVRADMVTLKEHHDHLLSNSFDASFQGNQLNGPDPSSSQADHAFALDDPLFSGLDGGFGGGIFGLGDDLVQELGEGWGSPVKHANLDEMDVDVPPLDFNTIPIEDRQTGFDAGFMLGDDLGLGMPDYQHPTVPSRPASVDPLMQTPNPERRKVTQGKENPGPPPQALSPANPQPPASPANSFAQLLLTQDDEPSQPEPAPLADLTTNHQNNVNKRQIKKSHKRTRLLLDARTELTDEELKIARAQYLSEQHQQRRDFWNKRLEKDSGKLIEEMIWGAPEGIEAPALREFWQENFKVQVEARTGLIRLDILERNERPTKRRKVTDNRRDDFNDYNIQIDGPEYADFNRGNDGEVGRGDVNFSDGRWNNDVELRLRSSEEPGQARQMSRPPSDIGANFSFDLASNDQRQEGSQRSSLFPWDNAGAGPSSSVGAGGGSDRISIDRAETRMRGNSFSRRDSSLALSQTGSTGIRGISPADMGVRNSDVIGEDFVFSGVEPENTQATNTQTMNTNTQLDSQKSELNLITLERNSFNFLEYVKMQQQAMPIGSESISFDDVVPKLTSTRHVAAAAFYHCLVLTTKNLLHVSQKVPHGAISLRIV